jgi:DNA-directed RNA polymerase subunit RPC12/RpoP
MSDTFKMECPECGQHIECPNELFGQSVDCPSCGSAILTGESPISAPPVLQASPPIAPRPPLPPKPPLWNVFALLGYYRERARIQQALLRESRCNYIASVLDLIRRGEWSLSVQNVLLMRNEKVLWSEPATLYEWKTVGRHYENTLFSSRGKMITDKAEAPVAEGAFILPPR